MRRSFTAAVVAALALLLSGCGAGASQPRDESVAAEVAWTASETLLGDPLVVDGVILTYTSVGAGDVNLVARDLSTGSELWRQKSHPGISPRGIEHQPAALQLDDSSWVVAFLRADDYWERSAWSRVIIVDARSGLETTPPSDRIIATRPEVCRDVFCVQGDLEGNGAYRLHDFPASTTQGARSVESWTSSSLPYLEGGRMLGDYTSSEEGDDGIERLRFGADGAIVWSRDYQDVFGPGTSSDNGWVFRDRDERLPVIGVSYGARHQAVDGQPRSLSLPSQRTAALDRGTGATIWEKAAAPCSASGESLRLYDDVFVLCRFVSGEVTQPEGASGPTFSDVDLELIGVEASTGAERWSLDLGADEGNFAWGSAVTAPRFADGGDMLVSIEGRVHRVVPLTGRTEAVGDDEVLLCLEPADYAALDSVWEGDPLADYVTSDVLRGCLSDGSTVTSTAITAGTLRRAGFEADEAGVLNFASGLTAFRPTAAIFTDPSPSGRS